VKNEHASFELEARAGAELKYVKKAFLPYKRQKTLYTGNSCF